MDRRDDRLPSTASPSHAGAADPSEEPVTARDEAGEPASEGEASNEAEHEGEASNEAERDEARDEPSSEPSQDDAARYLELAQRAQADFENYKKRMAKDLAAAGERARGGLVRELLPVVDNLERALAAVEGAGGAGRPANGDRSEQHLADGVRLVHSELVGVLERNGVEAFDPKGDAFDPSVHEALSTRPEEGAEAGVVLDVVEKGYKLNGTVLRPARVVVSG
jgi:molecular chaperone GrpE